MTMYNKVHKECPLTKEEMDAVKAELYYINSTNHCANPPHPSWYRGLNDWQCKQMESKASYREWLEKELINMTEQGTCNLQNL